MAAIDQLTAAQLSSAYSRGELSPLHVAKVLLERIAAWEPRINAMYRVARDAALEQARAAEQRWRTGRALSPLDGVPVTIKENIATQGDPSPVGTRANEDAPAQAADAPPAARLREAGCVLLGKTTMPDYGMLSSGLSSLHGVTRHPWRLDLNPAGSSSGAAAAAVAGYAPLHVGTDIGGSVRLPAAHCGLFALKPSLGRVPILPPYMGRVAGPITRTVDDAASLMEVLSQPDARDFTSLPSVKDDFSRTANAKELRVGLLLDMRCGLPVHPDVRTACEAAARALERAGARVEPLPSFLTSAMLDGICRFFEARSHADIAALAPAQRDKVLPFIVEWCTWRANRFSGDDVIRAYAQVMAMRQAAVAASAPFDLLLTPVSPVPHYPAESASPTDDPRNALAHIAFTVPFSMSEQPAAAIGWDYDADGLPLGVQLVGRRFDDAGVLAAARLVERLRPAQRPWPQ